MAEFRKAVHQEAAKVFTAFITWGVGLIMMLAYCLFIYWLNLTFGVFVMIIGAMFFLTAAFFAIDLWWGYSRVRKITD